MDWGTELWDQFDNVERHTQWGLDLMEKYVKFVKERTEIEQAYAKQLRLSYIIGKDTWIEKWPNKDECRKPDFQNLCQNFLEFSEALAMFGCPT